MAKELTVTHEVRTDASPEAMWEAVIDPTLYPVHEPRLSLTSQWGVPGELGSGYELASLAQQPEDLTFRKRPDARPHSVSTGGSQYRYEVVESVRPSRLTLETRSFGRTTMRQQVEILQDRDETLLRWTITQWPLFGLRGLTEVWCRRALVNWLSFIVRDASDRG